MAKIPFTIIGGHLMQIPAKVNGKEVEFLLDTGIGPSVLSMDFAEELNLHKVGAIAGKRMSGQEIEIPLVKVPSMEVGNLVRENLDVGIFDTSGFPAVLKDIKGILSIGFFRGSILTIDYHNSYLVVTDKGTNDRFLDDGTRVPVEIEYNGPSITLYVSIRLPSGRITKFEVDTGSDLLIVNSKLMGELGVDPNNEGVESIKGTDETGHDYERFFAEIEGEIAMDKNPDIMQKNPRAIFQDIIYDGLLGHDFLKKYLVSFDIDNKEMIFYRQ